MLVSEHSRISQAANPFKVCHRTVPRVGRLQFLNGEDRVSLPSYLDIRVTHDIRQRGQVATVLERKPGSLAQQSSMILSQLSYLVMLGVQQTHYLHHGYQT